MFQEPKAARSPVWCLVGLSLALAAAAVPAQPAASASLAAGHTRADPTDPKAPVPQTLYLSPLRAYQGFADVPVAPWRETNETVRQRGGWRAYAREPRAADAAVTTAPAASAAASAAKAAPHGHTGHEMK
jgi:hypothetical protein